MRTPLAFACSMAVLLLAVSCATAGDTPSSTAPRSASLSGGQCLDSGRARSWTSLDDRRILVDGGHYKYRIEVAPGCSGLNFEHSIGFSGDPIFGRICGMGDELIVRDYPCPIHKIELLSNEQYKQARKDHAAERKARKEARKSKSS